MAEKENRCWPGYEPVKGKKPYSKGSCRPKAESKTTASEKKFRAKRSNQLDEWQKEHPGAKRKAAQHLELPGSSTTKKKSAPKKPAKSKA
ncbi:MAG: hypothetical protein M3Y57_10515 [Acidobacteriota bacterium]|nr:hypothetical protein [Acidobacteriota bacterium]